MSCLELAELTRDNGPCAVSSRHDSPIHRLRTIFMYLILACRYISSPSEETEVDDHPNDVYKLGRPPGGDHDLLGRWTSCTPSCQPSNYKLSAFKLNPWPTSFLEDAVLPVSGTARRPGRSGPSHRLARSRLDNLGCLSSCEQYVYTPFSC